MKYKVENLKKIIKELTKTIDRFPIDRREDVLFNQWGLKDVLAHISGWNLQRVKELEDFIKGNKIEVINNFDEFNHRRVNERKFSTWEIVYGEFITSCTNLVKSFHSIPDNLINKKIWEDKSHTPLKWFDIDLSHLKEHFDDIKNKTFIAATSWITSKTCVRNSAIGTKGLFATEPISKDEKVVVWKTGYTDKEGSEKAKKEGKLIMQWDDNLYSFEERGDDIGYYINHSCDSNLWMKNT